MVDIVLIHGMNMNRSHRLVMQQNWRAAIVEGLRDIRSSHAESVEVECAFYGHEYNDGKLYGDPDYAGIDLEPGFETDFVIALGEVLEENDTSGKLYLPGALQRALVAIQRSRLFDHSDSFLIAFVKQVNRYLSDPSFRGRVHTEVSAAMAHSPRVIIGHSLGSLVAYNWLRSNELGNWPALITIGSPLGLEVVRRRVLDDAGYPCWPGQVPSWTNIAAKQDAVAMVKKLAPLYSPDICDQLCDNPRDSAHDALSYLSNMRTAWAIEGALT